MLDSQGQTKRQPASEGQGSSTRLDDLILQKQALVESFERAMADLRTKLPEIQREIQNILSQYQEQAQESAEDIINRIQK